MAQPTAQRIAVLTEMAIDGAAEGATFEIPCEEMVEILALAFYGRRIADRPVAPTSPAPARGDVRPSADELGGGPSREQEVQHATAAQNAAPGGREPPHADLPACCVPSDGADLAEQLYCAYNRAGARPGLNYQGLPCPVWLDLPVDIRHKWGAVEDFAVDLVREAVGLVPPCDDGGDAGGAGTLDLLDVYEQTWERR